MPVLQNAQTGEAELLEDAKAIDALQSKSYNAFLIDPEGDPVAVPLDQAKELLKTGYSNPSSDQFQKILNATKFDTGLEQAKAVGQGLLKGTIPVVGGEIAESLFGDTQARAEVNPNLEMAAEVGGLIGSEMLGYGLGSMVAKAGKAVEASIPALKALGKMGASGARLGVENALITANDQAAKLISGEDPEQTAQSIAAEIGFSAGVGALFGAAGTGTLLAGKKGAQVVSDSKIAQGIKGMLSGGEEEVAGQVPSSVKKMFNVFLGVPEDVTEKYVAERAAVESAPEFEKIRAHVLNYVDSVTEKADDAKATLTDLNSSFKEAKRDILAELKLQGMEAKQAENIANTELKKALSSAMKQVESKAYSKAPDIVRAIEKKVDTVSELSSDSLGILDDKLEPLNLTPVYKEIDNIADDIRSGIVGDSEKNALKVLEEKEKLIRAFPDGMAAPAKLKPAIQALDKITKYARNKADFDQELNGALKRVRYELDQALKDHVPEYREAMKPVAEIMENLNNLKKYGNERGAIKAINGLRNSTEQARDLPVLRKLEELSGIKFLDDIEPYINKALKEETEKLLPEYEIFKKAEQEFNLIKDPVLKLERERALLAQLEESALGKQLKQAEIDLQSAKAMKQSLRQFSEAGTEGILKNEKRAKLYREELLKLIPDMDEGSVKELSDLAVVREAFGKGSAIGSRSTVGGGLLGGLLGLIVAGPLGAGVAAPLGGAIGMAVDKYGPRMAKGILDRYIDMYGLKAATGNAPRSAIRLAVAKVLDQGREIAPDAFRAAVRAATLVYTAEKAMDTKVDAIIEGKKLEKTTPKVIDREKLKELVDEAKTNPHAFLNLEDSLSELMPDQSTMMTASIGRVVNFLSQLDASGRVDSFGRKIPESLVESQEYDTALRIAEEPLSLLDKVASNEITEHEVMALQEMYPALYSKISQKLITKIADQSSEGRPVDYDTLLSVAIFTGQPLDGSMTSEAIASIQQKQAINEMERNQPASGVGSAKNLKRVITNQASNSQMLQMKDVG